MSDTIGFDLHLSAQPENDQPVIEIGDIVRPKSGGPILHVTDIDGEHVYCAGFIDPFGAAGLEIVGV